ncbi:hypothetical protein D3C87_1684280 [compost metagenome]
MLSFIVVLFGGMYLQHVRGHIHTKPAVSAKVEIEESNIAAGCDIHVVEPKVQVDGPFS